MLSVDLVKLLEEHLDAKVVLKYGYTNYPVHNAFVENGIIFLRCFKLLTKAEKIECDVSYGDEDVEWTAEELVEKLTDIMSYMEEDSKVQLSVPDGEYDTLCAYDESIDSFVFSIEGEDEDE